MITLSHTYSAYVQFAGNAHGYCIEALVEQKDTAIGNGSSDREVFWYGFRGTEFRLERGDANAGFGRAVSVDPTHAVSYRI